MFVRKRLVPMLCLALMGGVAWPGEQKHRGEGEAGLGRGSAGRPALAGHAGLAIGSSPGDRALLIDRSLDADQIKAQGIKKIDDGVSFGAPSPAIAAPAAAKFLAQGISVRAPRASAPWLTPEASRNTGRNRCRCAIPRTAYLVVPEGFKASIGSLQPTGRRIDMGRLDNPGDCDAGAHSQDHVAYAARKGKDGSLLLFCGDALAGAGERCGRPTSTDGITGPNAGLKTRRRVAPQSSRN